MECYSAIRRNEVLIYAETRTIPENRTRSEKKPVTKGSILCTAPFVRTSRTGKFREMTVLPGPGVGAEATGTTATGHGGFFEGG